MLCLTTVKTQEYITHKSVELQLWGLRRQSFTSRDEPGRIIFTLCMIDTTLLWVQLSCGHFALFAAVTFRTMSRDVKFCRRRLAALYRGCAGSCTLLGVMCSCSGACHVSDVSAAAIFAFRPVFGPQDDFVVCVNKQFRSPKRRVFLFEEMVVVAKTQPAKSKKETEDTYHYKEGYRVRFASNNSCFIVCQSCLCTVACHACVYLLLGSGNPDVTNGQLHTRAKVSQTSS